MPIKDVDTVLDSFCYLMQNNSSFYNFVTLGRTNVYKKFINYFNGKRFDPNYSAKYNDGCWARNSYPLVRNVYDAFSKHRNLKNYSYDAVSSTMYRDLLTDRLLKKIGKGNNENQFNLFEMESFIEKNSDDSDKKLEIINVFENIESGLIEFENGRFKYNEEVINKLDFEDREEFKNLLDSRLVYFLYYFVLHRDNMNDANHKDYVDNHYGKLIEEDHKHILELLKNKNILDNAYSWIKLYNRYIDKVSGDVNGKQKYKGEQ